jgi:hypothetical protein
MFDNDSKSTTDMSNARRRQNKRRRQLRCAMINARSNTTQTQHNQNTCVKRAASVFSAAAEACNCTLATYGKPALATAHNNAVDVELIVSPTTTSINGSVAAATVATNNKN